MAYITEQGIKLILTEVADSNFTITKEATVWSEVDGDDMDYVILYEYTRKGADHSSDMITLDAEQFEKVAAVLGYVKEIE